MCNLPPGQNLCDVLIINTSISISTAYITAILLIATSCQQPEVHLSVGFLYVTSFQLHWCTGCHYPCTESVMYTQVHSMTQ